MMSHLRAGWRGEFAQHVKLDVQIEDRPKPPGLSMQATMPAESIADAPSNKPMVVLHPNAPVPAAAAGAKKLSRDDSMAETPNAARPGAAPVAAAMLPPTIPNEPISRSAGELTFIEPARPPLIPVARPSISSSSFCGSTPTASACP